MEFINFDKIILEFNKINEECEYSSLTFNENSQKDRYLNLINNLNDNQKIELINYCIQNNNDEFIKFIENTFFWDNPNNEIIAIYITIDKKYILENKKYFLKKFYNPLLINDEKTQNTCILISTMLDEINNNIELDVFPIFNINTEVYNFIIEFLKYYFKYPWYSIRKPILSNNIKDNIVYKKIIDNELTKFNKLPYWNESLQYIFNQDDNKIDENSFWKDNQIHIDWYDDWLNRIYENSDDMIYKILNGANYLDIQPILELCSAKVACTLRDKKPEEIKKFFS